MVPRLQILLAFLLWSTTGPFVRAAELPVANFITAANAVGLAFLLAFFPRRIASGLVGLPRGPMARLAVAGAVNVWSSYIAFSYTSVANVIIFHYAAPVLVAAAAPFLLGEKPEARTWEALALSLAGLLASAWQDVAVGGGRDLVGIALSLVSALGYAVAILESRTVSRAGCDPFATVLVQGGFLSLVSLPLVAWDHWPMTGTLLAGTAGFLHLGVAAALYLVGLARVPAASGAVLGYSEIVFGMAWGLWLFAEPVTAWKVAGASAIMGGGWLIVRPGKTQAPPA